MAGLDKSVWKTVFFKDVCKQDMKLERFYLNTCHEPWRGSLKRRLQKAETLVQGTACTDGL